MSNILNKRVSGIIKSIDKENHRVTVYVSTPIIDRDGEILDKDGWMFTHYKDHPVLMSSHDYRRLTAQIGKALNWGVDDFGLWVEFEYFVGEGNFEADWGWKLVEKGVAAYSVGFKPLEWQDVDVNGRRVRKYTKQELWEVSQVTIPANPQAVVRGIEEGDESMVELVIKAYGKLREIYKGAVPPHSTPESSRESWDKNVAINQLRKWASSDGSGDKDKIDWNKYRLGFAWFDASNKENFGSYKLPHHYVEGGQLKVCKRGVFAGMGALSGARGGVDIPEEDKRKVYNHLAKHYRDLGVEPPEYGKVYTEAELKEMFKDVWDEIGLMVSSSKSEGGDLTEEEILIRAIEELIEEYKNKKGGQE